MHAHMRSTAHATKKTQARRKRIADEKYRTDNPHMHSSELLDCSLSFFSDSDEDIIYRKLYGPPSQSRLPCYHVRYRNVARRRCVDGGCSLSDTDVPVYTVPDEAGTPCKRMHCINVGNRIFCHDRRRGMHCITRKGDGTLSDWFVHSRKPGHDHTQSDMGNQTNVKEKRVRRMHHDEYPTTSSEIEASRPCGTRLFSCLYRAVMAVFTSAPVVRRAGCIPLLNDRVVLVYNRKGELVLPKGRIKPNEASRACARREALEEAGIEGTLS